jgi:ankyrin repeat protein
VLQKLVPVLEFIFIADALPKTTACWKTLSSHGLLLELPFPGHCDVVELLLSRGIDVDLDSARGTPLQVAAMYKQHDTMKILLEHHANVRHRFLVLSLLVQKKILLCCGHLGMNILFGTRTH